MHTVALLAATFRLLLPLLLIAPYAHAGGRDFDDAKRDLRRHVYYDQTAAGDLYCGCKWKWMNKTGGRVDLKSCGYQVRAQAARAQRIEWEHVVPAYAFGSQLPCWRKGGRKQCMSDDARYREMEGDLHNLAPAVGEVNGDRGHFRYGVLPGVASAYGACPTKVDFKQRVAEPRDEVKGFVARVQFYMHDRYRLRMSRQQQQLFIAWNRQFPVTAWERERDRRIAKIVGHSNPYVTHERQWALR